MPKQSHKQAASTTDSPCLPALQGANLRPRRPRGHGPSHSSWGLRGMWQLKPQLHTTRSLCLSVSKFPLSIFYSVICQFMNTFYYQSIYNFPFMPVLLGHSCATLTNYIPHGPYFQIRSRLSSCGLEIEHKNLGRGMQFKL